MKKRSTVFGIGALLVAINLLVFAPVRHYGYVELDDPSYVKENVHVSGGLTADNVSWAFTAQHGGYWIPLTWLSYMAEVTVSGGNEPGFHHAGNLLLHVLNTLLLFGVLSRMTGRLAASGVVAALFAVHPLHVESVAWITERKDMLSTFFLMLALWAYVSYARSAQQPAPSTGHAAPGMQHLARYLLVHLFFACSLMSKPMLVTLPFGLLLLDFWPLARLAEGRRATLSEGRSRRRGEVEGSKSFVPLIVEKLPLLAIAIAASVVAFLTQQQVGATADISYTVGQRFSTAIVSYVRYIQLMFWPAGLAAFYPIPRDVPLAWVAACLLALVAVSGVAILFARRIPYLAVGWFWYLGTMLPVIGIVQVGLQGMADRFTYVPLVGLFVAIVWGFTDLVARREIGPDLISSRARIAMACTAVLVVGALAISAHAQLQYWQNNVTLFTRATQITLNVDEYQAHMSLAAQLAPQGRQDEVIDHLTRAAKLRPGSAEVHAALGLALSATGTNDQAVVEYREALRLNPASAAVHNNLGTLLAQRGRMDEARSHFAEAVRLAPDFDVAHVNLAMALASQGATAQALSEFQEALRINPSNGAARAAVQQLNGR